MKEIQLTQGKTALVDDEDYEELNKYKWFVCKCGPHFYASREGKMVNRKRFPMIRMHREIMKPPEGLKVDHINMDTLNNQRDNLRLCTHQQNLRNRKSCKGSTSRFKGVCWDKSRTKWMATIKVDVGQQKYLGRHDSEVVAARAYNNAAINLFGDFARLNFI